MYIYYIEIIEDKGLERQRERGRKPLDSQKDRYTDKNIYEKGYIKRYNLSPLIVERLLLI